MRHWFLFGWLLWVLLPHNALAAVPCDIDGLSASGTRVGTVTATRVHFVSDDDELPGCPSKNAHCVAKAYLVAGDTVLLGSTREEYVCAGYVSERGNVIKRWLPAEAIKPVTEEGNLLVDWEGRWESYEKEIRIAPGKTGYVITGEAIWKGAISVHDGKLSGEASPSAGRLAFAMGEDKTLPFDQSKEFDCRVSMIRRGPYLLVKDNNQCGGVNVTFTGFYRRLSGPLAPSEK